MPSHADDGQSASYARASNGSNTARQWLEVWAGGEVLANSWSTYTGATMALTGDITQPGWRMRATAGYGQYSYTKSTNGVGGPTRLKLKGQKVFSDALLGYQFQ